MSYSLFQILLFIIVYLSVLFAVAYFADRGSISRRITHHPAVYVLSLGVFAGVMATNGVVALAQQHGYSFLLYYLGTVVVFIFAALLLMPLLRLCRVYQLSSLADVLTFRFRSRWIGAAISAAMCLTLMPLLALQIQAVAESIHLLAGDTRIVVPGLDRHNQLALFFCIIITVFSILFGTRHRSSLERNTGLVTAIAFESLVKLSALGALMLASIWGVFNGFEGLQKWLTENAELATSLQDSVDGDVARTLLLVFFAGAVCMPHMFHMTFAENNDSGDLGTATWSLPLYLLLLSLPVLPIAWASIKLGSLLPPEYSGLAIGMALKSTSLSGAAFVATLSAASATIIVTTLALANMCLHHIVVPFRLQQSDPDQSLYRELLWARRTLIAVLILGAYVFYATLVENQGLITLGLVAFAGTLQFLPGIVATPYWPRANRTGLLAGLSGGLLIWILGLLLPMIADYDPTKLNTVFSAISGVESNTWAATTLVAIFINCALFIIVSLLKEASPEEQIAAEICSMDSRAKQTRQILSLSSAAEFGGNLAPALGERTANSEVSRALAELQFSPEESRPYALRRLRSRIEANLSGLLGPAVARQIIDSCLPFQPGHTDKSDDIHLIERDLEQEKPRLYGLAADLDNLRRHHRSTLDKLPIGACSTSAEGELFMWNRSMERITGIPASQVLGSLLSTIPKPWGSILESFRTEASDSAPKTEVAMDDAPSRWVSLHKSAIEDAVESDDIILVEDITDYEMLETELLHNERLASIGRLAAGVAHEIGNPVTGIACLAQNLEYETDEGEIRFMAQDILKQTGRVTRIVESLMNFSHTGGKAELQLAPSNLADCIDEAIHLLSLDRQSKPVQFINDCDRELLVTADSQRLLQVFVNLLGNGRDACEDYGVIRTLATEEAGIVTIDVEDSGCGIPLELQSQVFEPFVTTKDPGAGTGLGLALVFSIVDDMGGKVQVTSPIFDGPNPGTRVSLQLQRASYGNSFQM
jgi:PAS domain S-box-containing protein